MSCVCVEMVPDLMSGGVVFLVDCSDCRGGDECHDLDSRS